MRAYAGGPYMGLRILQYLIEEGGKMVEDFLKNPKNSIKHVTETVLATKTIEDMATTWKYNTGKCTSFTIQTVTNVHKAKDEEGQPIYEFNIYDLGHHRVARCIKTTVVIDSSSTIPGGAFCLPEDGWYRSNDTNANWKFKSSEYKFEREVNVEGRPKKSSSPISDQQAMVICLKEAGETAYKTVPTLFRSVDPDGKPHSHGILVWCPAAHAIEIASGTDDWRNGRKKVIQWATYKKTKKGAVIGLEESIKGSVEDPQKCQQAIIDLSKPTGALMFNKELYAAAVKLWAWPKLIENTF